MENSFDIEHCREIGCEKVNGKKCLAYADPANLIWHRHGKECPAGPRTFDSKKEKVRVGQQKQKHKK